MIGFAIGVFIGSSIGLFAAAICASNKTQPKPPPAGPRRRAATKW